MNRIRMTLVLAVLCAVTARAEEPSLPMFRSFAGAFFGTSMHDFFVESELTLPLWSVGPVGLYHRYRETTPFIGLEPGGQQAELLYTRHEFQADLKLNDHLRAWAVAGFHRRSNQDRHVRADAYALGAGLGSPRTTGTERLSWQVAAGGYASRANVQSEWWGDGRAAWRVFDLNDCKWVDSTNRVSVLLSADVETANQGGRIQGMYRVGPELQAVTAMGNRLNLHARWYINDSNEFYRSDDEGLLVGMEITSSLDPGHSYNAREQRVSGLLPLVWGAYDVGMGATRRVSRFEMNVEAVDMKLAERIVTLFVWYESRQEYRTGEFDNIAYSVSLGLQSPVGLASVLSQGNPLVVGMDFVHRSDHALAPSRDRVRADGKRVSNPELGRILANGGLNLLPRLRLQTIGWDLPYRDPTMYDDKIAWLHFVDWRVTAGCEMSSDRQRGDFAGQIGLNWDAATIRGFVVYGRAIGSIGNETPDWLFEAGLRRPFYRLFVRYESYGIKSIIAQGDTLIGGVGFHL